jgi:FkbM family methyltransferase
MNRTDPALPRPLGTRLRRELLHLSTLSGQLWRLNFSVNTVIAGRPMRIPVLFGQGSQNLALLEPGVFGALEKILALSPGTVFDVGVNVGQTLLKVKALDWHRSYVGFEINPRCCQYVDALIAANRFPECTLVPAGLSDRNGLTTLWLRRNVSLDPAASTISEVCDDAEPLRPQYAAICRGDEAVGSLNVRSIAVIKIDTEGAELEVLRGLVDTIGKCRPFIICEILPVGDVAGAAGQARLQRQNAVQGLLNEWNYVLFRLLADTTLQPVADIGIHHNLDLTNYLAVPREKLHTIAAAFVLRRDSTPTAAFRDVDRQSQFAASGTEIAAGASKGEGIQVTLGDE